MRVLPSSVLDDHGYTVPTVASAPSGMAWLRSAVPRFVDGPVHAHRRALVEDVLTGVVVAPAPGSDPTMTLAQALGLPDRCVDDVALVAAAYQPHAEQSRAADEAADRLVETLGGRSERAAAMMCVLVQAHAVTRALAGRIRSGDPTPPVPTTRRRDPTGAEVLVDLADAPFGRGRHACPGRELALALAAAAAQR